MPGTVARRIVVGGHVEGVFFRERVDEVTPEGCTRLEIR